MLVKKVISKLDSSKVPGPDCIPVVVLKDCKPELSYILAEFFNMHLKESCFYWWSLYLIMLGKCLQLKTTACYSSFCC